jgi:integrase
MKLPSYLAISRYGIYYLRIERNGKERRRSLGTRDPAVAITAAYQFGAKIHAMTRRHLGYSVDTGSIKITTDGSADDHARAMEALSALQKLDQQRRNDGLREFEQLQADALLKSQKTQAHLPQQKPQPERLQTLQDALADYLIERDGGWTDGTLVTYNSIFNRFVAEFGATTFISDVTVEQFLKYRKRMESSSHPDTVDRDCGALIGWFDWAIKRQRYVGANPIEKPSLTASIRDILVTKFEKPRNPFTAADLEKIFAAVPAINNPADFWLPILGLYTGARIGELCSTKLDGNEGILEYEPGKWSMYLFGKSPSSKRRIPIHQNLIDCGFLTYIADVKRCWPDADRVFPHLVKDTKNGFANKPTNAFTELKQGLGLGEDKVFHSFRKTFVSCLQYNQLGEEWRRPFVGHDSDDDGGVKNIRGGDAHSVYSKARFDPARLAEIVFPAFDLVKWLGYTPPLPVYKTGQFDKYFASNLRGKLNRAARAAREDRMTAHKSGKW